MLENTQRDKKWVLKRICWIYLGFILLFHALKNMAIFIVNWFPTQVRLYRYCDDIFFMFLPVMTTWIEHMRTSLRFMCSWIEFSFQKPWSNTWHVFRFTKRKNLIFFTCTFINYSFYMDEMKILMKCNIEEVHCYWI